jgi:hypothetical protein
VIGVLAATDVLHRRLGAVMHRRLDQQRGRARRQVTEDGLQFTFALNHTTYFVLTECCVPLRIRTPPWTSTIFTRRRLVQMPVE